MQRPFSQACENNKQPILEVIQPLLAEVASVLEIGSGTGQHAVHFAAAMPELRWQPSDQREYLDGIEAWRAWAQLPNLLPALELDVRNAPWPLASTPAIFSANTVHIMHWPQVVQLFEGIARHLDVDGIFLLYGPFNYDGRYTSDSNARFDQWLQQRDPGSGIRDFERLQELAAQGGLAFRQDYAMPANNRLLYWRKS